jgi:hypothetical protein
MQMIMLQRAWVVEALRLFRKEEKCKVHIMLLEIQFSTVLLEDNFLLLAQ